MTGNDLSRIAHAIALLAAWQIAPQLRVTLNQGWNAMKKRREIYSVNR
jgi:hypothetical protein